MAYFVVSYDLIKRKDYPELIGALEELGAQKSLLSQWFVDNACSAADLYAHLLPHIDGDDRLMVIEFSKKPAWNIGLKGTRDWIEARF
jgi:hypothetical protein